MQPVLLLQIIFIASAFSGPIHKESRYPISTTYTTSIGSYHSKHPHDTHVLPYKNSTLLPTYLVGTTVTFLASSGSTIDVDTEVLFTPNTHSTPQTLRTGSMSAVSNQLPRNTQPSHAQTYDTQHGSNWAFGSGELIGLVGTIFQILTLPPIAMHFMIQGRRIVPQEA